MNTVTLLPFDPTKAGVKIDPTKAGVLRVAVVSVVVP